MKKLISVFAALALVGSLAAQKKPAKPAAPAAPAAPAVKAPAAPAVAAPVAAPAPAASGKGMGLFVEARGTFTLGGGTSVSRATGDTGATTVDYKLPNTSGFGGGATIGYEIAQNLGIVASFDYRSIKSRKWETTNSAAPGFGVATQNTTNTMVLGIGFRPSVNALGGTWYAGAGFAYVLPYSSETTIDYTSPASAGFTATNATVKDTWNAGIGAYGELGYNYSLTDNLYLGLGVRLLVATANNDGKTREITTNGSVSAAASPTGAAIAGASTTTLNYSASVDATKTKYESNGITDITAAVNVGFRF